MSGLERYEDPYVVLAICVDTSTSMAGDPLRDVEEFLSTMRRDFGADSALARHVSTCVITFGGGARVAQDWAPASEMEEVDLTPGGQSDVNGAVLLADQQIRAHTSTMLMWGIRACVPLALLLSDCADTVTRNVDEAVEVIGRRASAGGMRTLPLVCGKVDEYGAARIGLGHRALRLWDFGLGARDLVHFARLERHLMSVGAPVDEAMAKDGPRTAKLDPVLDRWLLE